jgi:hypothetical protein
LVAVVGGALGGGWAWETRVMEKNLEISGGEDGLERDERPWLACAGELAHLHEETVRIQRLVDEEFGEIEAEDWA